MIKYKDATRPSYLMREQQLCHVLENALRENDVDNIKKAFGLGVPLLAHDYRLLKVALLSDGISQDLAEQAVDLALEQGANTYALLPVLSESVRNHKWDVVRALVSKEVNLSLDGYRMLGQMCIKDPVGLAHYLAIDTPDNETLNNLFDVTTSSAFGRVEALGPLLDAGTSFQQNNTDDALHFVMGRIRHSQQIGNAADLDKSISLMTKLLEKGANPNAHSGAILSDAAYLKEERLFALLSAHGAVWSLMKPSAAEFNELILPFKAHLLPGLTDEFYRPLRQMLAASLLDEGMTLKDVAEKQPDLLFDVAYELGGRENAPRLGTLSFTKMKDSDCAVAGDDPRTLLFLVQYGEIDLMQRLLSKTNIPSQVKNKALQHAIWNNQLTLTGQLVEHRANINNDPHTTVMYAKAVCSMEMMKIIHEIGLDFGAAKLEWRKNEHRALGVGSKSVDDGIIKAAKRMEIDKHKDTQNGIIQLTRA